MKASVYLTAGLLLVGLVALSCDGGGCPPETCAASPDAGGDAEPDRNQDAQAEEPAPTYSCAQQSAALALALHAMPGSECTAVIRLDYRSLAPVGYQIVCGPGITIAESDARAAANRDTGFGGSADVAPARNPPSPSDEYVFFQTPSDFGGVAAVSARNGMTVFGGSIVWAGRGDINYPKDWKPAEELASGCPRAEGIPAFRGWPVGAEATDTGVAAAIHAVEQTALPAAMWRSGQVLDAVVLAYARAAGTVDPSDAASAEWIVLVNGD